MFVSTVQKVANASAQSSAGQVLTVRYFAWVREKIGCAEERVEVPAGVETVADLVVWLKSRGPEYAAAFGTAGVVRAALDQTHVKPVHLLAGAKEVAFFPPVTGG
jgi:sulfur-carrier protein